MGPEKRTCSNRKCFTTPCVRPSTEATVHAVRKIVCQVQGTTSIVFEVNVSTISKLAYNLGGFRARAQACVNCVFATAVLVEIG